ncbi:MAG: SH3 domain-containing protein [Breznakibacter sp.]
MKIRYILFLASCIFQNTIQIQAQEKPQGKFSLIQGIWERNELSGIEKSFKIINKTNTLGISYSIHAPDNIELFLVESTEGFQNRHYKEFDSIDVNSLKEDDGKYYTIILNNKYIKNGWIKKKYCIVPDYFECDGILMSINSGQLVEYEKITRLPSVALKLLYNRGLNDNRNYIKEYLGIEVEEIKSDKSIIFSNPETATKMYLTKGDVVTILEKKGNWLKIEFFGTKLVTGWIRQTDVKKTLSRTLPT